MRKEIRKKEKIMKIEKKTLTSHQKVGLLGEVQNVTLWMMLGCSLQVAM